MWWLNWRDPPLPAPHFSSFLSAVVYSFCSFHLSDPPSMSSHLSLHVFLHILLSIFMPFFSLSCFPLWSHRNSSNPFLSIHHHNNSNPFLSIHHLSLLHLNPPLLCLYISLPPLLCLPSLPPHSYAIFCCAWRIHLACGRLGSDGYISVCGEGGLVNRYLLLATMGSMRADADFPLG